MLNSIRKLLNMNLKTANIDKIYNKNAAFLDSLEKKQYEDFFHYLIIIYSDDIQIKNSTMLHHKFANDFFNIFFSKYSSIIIGKRGEVKISHDIILNNLDIYSYPSLTCIGYDFGEAIFINHNTGLGIFIDTIDSDEDINNNNSIYFNIYHYLITSIGVINEIILEELYKKWNTDK